MPRSAAIFALLAAAAAPALAAPPRELAKADYLSRLHGMWLAECVANWTGIKTEGRRSAPPFLTDADWGANPFPEAPGINVNYVLDQNPWWADDDTDIEYVYLDLLTTHAPATHLSPAQIADGWIAHCNSYIWVSNAAARALMSYTGDAGVGLGALPPATAYAQAWVAPSYADQSLMIDAQLTTELFGALAPGMPDVALDMADLPMRTIATGYAMHAAQFYIVLYSLATQVDRSLPPDEQALWLVREARKFIPDSSKSADIIDTVVTDFLANPDKDDWEHTRDLVYQRYQLDTAANGFRYRAWYESSVNLATGTIALLYGGMDLPRTIRIGTLSGWDSDNGPATMGGLLGLIMGYDAVVQSFAAQWPPGGPADRYWIGRTRSNMTDHLPDDPAADDTLTMMAERCMPIVERAILGAGGLADDTRWLLPPGGAGNGLSHAEALTLSPTHREFLRSSNAQFAAGAKTCFSNVPGSPSHWRYGSWYAPLIADDLEHNGRGAEVQPGSQGYFSTQRSAAGPVSPAIQSFTVQYAQPVTVQAVRFIEGDHFHSTAEGDYRGGWFESASILLRINNQWTIVAAAPAQPLDPLRPFQTIDFSLSAPVSNVTGICISGLPGGGPHAGNPNASPFVTCAELDALAPALTPARPSFDRNADTAIDAEDLYAYVAVPTDLNADSLIDAADLAVVRAAIRWREPAMMIHR
jgi:hypothetical protein